MARVLHITPHLGGGVGRALAALLGAPSEPGDQARLCLLEWPQKTQALRRIGAAGHRIDLAPGWPELRAAIFDADVVLFHFWNHPLCAAVLARPDWPPSRLAVWCHISGLGAAVLPRGLGGLVDRLVFTAAASLQAPVAEGAPRGRLAVVSSGVVEGLPPPPVRRAEAGALRVGYVGTLGPEKLHPDFVRAAAGVRLPGFHVTMLGDDAGAGPLAAQAASAGRPDLLRFVGHQEDVFAWLSGFDALLYLLNPAHFGTAEIALLEAMAMGVAPVVMDNPTERAIVRDGETGVIVADADAAARAVERLAADPAWRARLSASAAAETRAACGPERLRREMSAVLAELMSRPKRARGDATEVLGAAPADWFRAFRGDAARFRDDGAVAPDVGGPEAVSAWSGASKGGVAQFARCFPGDPRLARWADAVAAA